ncbi:putative short-chain dehydrogenase [Xylariaceae sp. FL1651]|nr:putative short-chain dehydrogenase [Xylariaceae sp. FL1651]
MSNGMSTEYATKVYPTTTDPIHRNTYPAISPLRPELSQAGRTVLITGGNSGIGYGIAHGFIQASAAKVIILGRRAEVVASAAQQLTREAGPDYKGVVVGLTCDIGDATAVDALWQQLRAEGTVVDVLVLNATGLPRAVPLLELGTDALWQVFDVSVRAQMQLTERFYRQEGKGASETKYLVYVSTACIHDFDVGEKYLAYGLTKHTGQLMFQLIAQDTPAEKMQILGFHPGAIYTDAAKGYGWDENSFPWDHVDLPSHFAVWAASPEARFMHGRFAWAAWDVEQLQRGEIRKRIDGNPDYLKVGVHGL